MVADYLKSPKYTSKIWSNLRKGHVSSGKKLCFKQSKRDQNPLIIDNGKMEVEVESVQIIRGVCFYCPISRTLLHEHIPHTPRVGKYYAKAKFVDNICRRVQGGYVSHMYKHSFSRHSKGK